MILLVITYYLFNYQCIFFWWYQQTHIGDQEGFYGDQLIISPSIYKMEEYFCNYGTNLKSERLKKTLKS